MKEPLYCQVCGSEVVRGDKQKSFLQKMRSKKKERAFCFTPKKKKQIIKLSLIIGPIILIAILAPTIPRIVYNGNLHLRSAGIITQGLHGDFLEIRMDVNRGKAWVKEVTLFSQYKQTNYGTIDIQGVYKQDDFIVATFTLIDEMPELTDGFSLYIKYLYGNNWVTYYF
ncbi:MAG: hypothetical protein HZR80_02670 [Candidatus Heimdallarchaeota archaeon]